jgi:hypothetical protein
MPYCTICDVELVEGTGSDIASSIVKKAVEAGLRPPPGKLRRTAKMLERSEEAVSEKEAELERRWVDRLLNDSASHMLLCDSCKGRAGQALNVYL